KFFLVSNALVCWTCVDDDCLLPKVNWTYILCDQDYVNTSHHQISSIYGLEPSPPKNVKNFECVEIDTKLQFTNSSEKFASFKGCVENKFNISSFSPNSTIYLNEERNEFRTCDMEMCNKLEISRPIPPLTTPSTNTTTTPVVSTPAINNTTTPVVSTPASNITTSVASTPPSPSTPIPPPALKCYICTDEECSKTPKETIVPEKKWT
uniref:Uncharacterized protein n=1 Tax=Megaselia scalaris TaxID=36166 RepID=T1GGN3_MEGSC